MQATLVQNRGSGKLQLLRQSQQQQRALEQESEEGHLQDESESNKSYLSTNIVVASYITIADIRLLETSYQELKSQSLAYIEKMHKHLPEPSHLDPRVNIERRLMINGRVSLFSVSQLQQACQWASTVVAKQRGLAPEKFMDELTTASKKYIGVNDQLTEFHGAQPRILEYLRVSADLGQLPKRLLKRQKNISNMSKALQLKRQLCWRLKRESDLSVNQISSRLGKSRYWVRKTLSQGGELNASKSIIKRQHVPPKRLHERAQLSIIEYVESSKDLVQSTQIRDFLYKKKGIKLSCRTIQKFLKEKLGMSYNRTAQVLPQQNSLDCLLQRQFAAYKYIEALSTGKILINIDESVIRATDCRVRGWVRSRQQRVESTAQRLYQINIISGVASSGEVYFTVNKGKTNQITFIAFLTKLFIHLDAKRPGWRSNSIIVLDNAAYHRGRETLDFIRQSRVSSLFLGPYHYKMAPVENFFAFIKSRNLNALNTRVHSNETTKQYLKEMSLQISRLDFSWVKKAFVSHLTGALESLNLQPN